MCDKLRCEGADNAHPRWLKLRDKVKALRFPTRWTIIEFIGDGTRSTTEIFRHLESAGEKLTKPGFYYHLSELKNAGIIEVSDYIEEGGGAPEKVWRLKTKRIEFDLLGTE
ncbi:MAG: ArsR family transcriptional regulator [Thermoplasmata archaeon]